MTGDQNELKKKQEVLQRIIDCDLPLYSNFKTDSTPDFVQQSCSERDFCFAQETKQFCQVPFCSNDSTGDQVSSKNCRRRMKVVDKILFEKVFRSNANIIARK